MTRILLVLNLLFMLLLYNCASAKNSKPTIENLTEQQCKSHLTQCVKYAYWANKRINRLIKIVNNCQQGPLIRTNYERID